MEETITVKIARYLESRDIKSTHQNLKAATVNFEVCTLSKKSRKMQLNRLQV